MPGKKILWLCSWYPSGAEPFNGDFIQRHAIASALLNDIYVIHVSALTGGMQKDKEDSLQQKQHLTEQIVCFKKSMSWWGRWRAHMRLLKLYREAIQEYIAKNGKPDLVHVHVPIWSGLFAIWLKKKYGIPFLVTEHWGIYNDIEINNYQTKSAKFKRSSREIFTEAAKFISPSRFLAEGVRQLVVKKEYEIIPNTVNTAFFNYKPKERKPFRFIHVSNMVPLKNAGGILKAFKIFMQNKEEVKLVMVGDTDPAIRKFADGLGFPKGTVSFRGEISYEGVAKEMQEANALILFSNIENSPCVIGEALCCGLPVITTAVGGIPELVDKTNSLMVKPGDEKIMALVMEEMMISYVDYDRAAIAEAAQKKFSYESIGKKMNKIYEQIIT